MGSITNTHPPWWNAEDDAAILAAQRWQRVASTTEPSAGVIAAFCCRRCRHWESLGGVVGRCGMRATPATVCCGETQAGDGCEQWEGREWIGRWFYDQPA
jgi:hypothetical protein